MALRPVYGFVIAALLAVSAPALGAWSQSPTTGTLIIDRPVASSTSVSDGSGGAYIVWDDYQAGNSNVDIYAQRVSSSGELLWASDGVVVCNATSNQRVPLAVSDGMGGIIILWLDFRSGNIDLYAQRLDSSGNALWTANGVAVCTATGDQTARNLVADGTGGAIISWDDQRVSPTSVYAQRLNAAGAPQWTANGLAVASSSVTMNQAFNLSDGAGGAVVVWRDWTGGQPLIIRGQRLDASGNFLWSSGGEVLVSAPAGMSDHRVVADGVGGAVMTWSDIRSDGGDIYAQKFNLSGNIQWTTSGVAVCTASAAQLASFVAPAASGGAIVVWGDTRSGGSNFDTYAQYLDAGGTPQWTTNGVVLGSGSGSQTPCGVIEDGAGGALLSWFDTGSDLGDLRVQRVNSSGTGLWGANGLVLCGAAGKQTFSAGSGNSERSAPVSDGTGGAIVTFLDYKSGNVFDFNERFRVYANRVSNTGVLLPITLTGLSAE